jgi:hypothetical protein
VAWNWRGSETRTEAESVQDNIRYPCNGRSSAIASKTWAILRAVFQFRLVPTAPRALRPNPAGILEAEMLAFPNHM